MRSSLCRALAFFLAWNVLKNSTCFSFQLSFTSWLEARQLIDFFNPESIDSSGFKYLKSPILKDTFLGVSTIEQTLMGFWVALFKIAL